jgi:Ca2+-binding EF-hand superfamily protein
MQRSNRPQRQTRTSSHQLSKLPDYLVLDLRESFKFFDPENSGYVSVHHLKAILQNFGMSKMPRKEMDEEISSVIGTSKVVDWNDLVTIMAQLQRGSYKD